MSELINLSNKLIAAAEGVDAARTNYGEIKKELFTALTGKIRAYSKEKKNIGFDMALLWLAGESEELNSRYGEMLILEQTIKGGEALMEAYKEKIHSIKKEMDFNLKLDSGFTN